MKQIPGQINIFIFFGGDIGEFRRRRRPKQNRSTLRNSWEAYGITKSAYIELREYCQNPEHANEVSRAAYETNALIGEHIFQSITRNLSFEKIEYLDGHRICVGRTDFYGWRRKCYAKICERLKDEKNK